MPEATFREEVDGTTVVMKRGTKNSFKRKLCIGGSVVFVLVFVLVLVISIPLALNSSEQSSPNPGTGPTQQEDPQDDRPDDIVLPDDWPLRSQILQEELTGIVAMSQDRIALATEQGVDIIDLQGNLIDTIVIDDNGDHEWHNQVAFSGNRVVFTVGDEVYVYDDMDNSGTFVASQTQYEPAGKVGVGGNDNIHFGQALAISKDGSTVAILSTASDKLSHVRVYRDDTVLDDIELPGESTSLNSLAMSADGNRIVVGIPDATNRNDDAFAGQVIFYELNQDTLKYDQMGTPTYGSAQSERLGARVAISDDGNVVAITPEDGGWVDVFEWDEFDWLLKGDRIEGDPNKPNEGFGMSLAVDFEGGFVVVGAPGTDAARKTHLGEVSIFHLDASSGRERWKYRGSVHSTEVGSEFGISIDISNEGETLVVGAFGSIHTYAVEEFLLECNTCMDYFG